MPRLSSILWEDDRAKHFLEVPSKHRCHRKVVGRSKRGFMKEKSSLSKLVALYSQMTSLEEKGRAVDVAHLAFSKAQPETGMKNNLRVNPFPSQNIARPIFFMAGIALTRTQNLGIVGIGRELLTSFSPSQLPRQSLLQLVAEGLVQLRFEYLQGWRLQNLSGQSGPLFDRPHAGDAISCILICAHLLLRC